jgi:lipopolysaccharide/colanic/teichoic acid biosynthesis glycosyltransferase
MLSPILILIGLAIWIDSPGSPLYRQTRLGQNGEEFTILKFRTMISNADDKPHRTAYERFATAVSLAEAGVPTFKIVKDPRVTRLGALLRANSLDELPQLLNVITGSMSLVGPRPPIPWETLGYAPRHWRRLSVKPGMTGLWQATARSYATFEEMVALDLKYIDHLSLAFDIKIMILTVGAVISRKGAG